jgi:fumarate hydratase subunit alpha
MRIISAYTVTQTVKAMFLKVGVRMDKDTKTALLNACADEDRTATKFALEIMTKNADIAEKTNTPLCQDTGMAIVFADIGQNVVIEGGNLEDAINEGVRQAYAEGCFRKSVLNPITRKNTGDNTPAVIHYNIVPGEKLTLSVMAKGFGSENMSRLFMLTPSEGIDGIKKAVVSSAVEAGGNPCPPVVVGVGIGGTMEKAAIMSKRALFRNINSQNEQPELRQLEKEILAEINLSGIGAQGFGGKLTALGVFIESFPTHLAGLPVAVTIQCHAVRHSTTTI